jgi:hypothetical protein
VALDAALDPLAGVRQMGIGDVGFGMAVLARHFAVVGMLEALLLNQQLGEKRHVHALAWRCGEALPAMAGQTVGVPFPDLLGQFRIDFGQPEIIQLLGRRQRGKHGHSSDDHQDTKAKGADERGSVPSFPAQSQTHHVALVANASHVADHPNAIGYLSYDITILIMQIGIICNACPGPLGRN